MLSDELLRRLFTFAAAWREDRPGLASWKTTSPCESRERPADSGEGAGPLCARAPWEVAVTQSSGDAASSKAPREREQGSPCCPTLALTRCRGAPSAPRTHRALWWVGWTEIWDWPAMRGSPHSSVPENREERSQPRVPFYTSLFHRRATQGLPELIHPTSTPSASVHLEPDTAGHRGSRWAQLCPASKEFMVGGLLPARFV